MSSAPTSSLCPTSFNLAQDVLSAGAHTPDKIALAVLGPARAERWSYARLRAAILGTATGLTEAGLAPGGRVLLRLGNTPEFPIAFLGAIAAGLVPVASPAVLTEREVTALAHQIGPVAVLGGGDGLAMPDHPAPVMSEIALIGLRDQAPCDPIMGDPDRPAYIVYTSGTSGTPRAVIHAHRAIRARRMMWKGWYGLTPDDRLLHAGAFNWTYTLGTGLLDPWAMGATALVPAPGTAHEALPLLLKRHDVTIFAAAPGVYRHVLRAGLPTLPRLRHGLSAGEKLPDATRAAWDAATGTAIHEAFGMSEVSTFISGAPSRPAPPGTLGFPQDGRRIAIVDDQGVPLPPGETGLIAVHKSDPGLMLGYFGADEDTRAKFRGDWFVSGDVGAFTPEGAIAYHGRDDDMMNAGGTRVSPIEVERALAEHAEIADCAAVEVEVRPDVTVIAAFYIADRDLDSDDLSRHMSLRLARYKTPRIYRRVPELPRNRNGKLLRKRLRDGEGESP